jgi:hypothetical protein
MYNHVDLAIRTVTIGAGFVGLALFVIFQLA